MKKEKNGNQTVIRINMFSIFAVVIAIVLVVSFFRNYIFATNDGINETETEQEETVEETQAIEENAETVDILQLMVDNNYSNKKMVNEEREVAFETETIETDQLPNGEEEVEQEGEVGKNQVTVLQTYENDELMEEEIIEVIVKEEPVKEIVYVGTSEFLSTYSVHIGDEMYLIESGDLKEEADEDSETLVSISRYLSVTLEEVSGDWIKVKYEDYEGYIEDSKLTSESVTPMIEEKNRIAELQDSLDMDMDLDEVSGLTLSDYNTIFAYNASDKNGIFADNAETFYNAEQEYEINGVFLAAIGIHESAWGTSTIATEKYNLFGYKAYDSDPEGSAQTFESYEDAINTVAEALATNYLSEDGSYYNGTTIEDVNEKYATDENWAVKVYAYMEYLYDKLG